MKNSIRKVVPAAMALAVSSFAGLAHGSGFQLMEQNASGLGNAYAGQAAAAENASTIFFNPAGMTRLPGKQVSAAVHAIRAQAEFTNSGGSAAPLGLASPGGNGGDAGDWAFVPNGYLSWQMSPRLWLGLGLSVPFGLKTEYDEGWVGRFQSQLAEIKTIDINPSIAFKLNETVSLGAGISYQIAEVKFRRSAILPPGAEGRVNLDVEDNGSWGFNLGAMFNLGTSTRVGVSYRSTIEHDLEGTVITRGGAVGTQVNSVKLTAELPDTLSVGLSHRLNPKFELLGDITYTRWSEIKALPLVATSTSLVGATGATLDTFNFQFKDTYRIGLGGNYQWSDAMTLKAGVAYDKSPVTDFYRLATLPDADRFWVAIGAKYRMSRQATLDFGYAHIFIDDPSIRQVRGVAPGSDLRGNVIGNYDSNVNIFSAQFTYSF
jgi:long-chain fatty acid transport protein